MKLTTFIHLVYSAVIIFVLSLTLISCSNRGEMLRVASLNKYDGKYQFKVRQKGWGDYGAADTEVVVNADSNFALVTSGPHSVTFGFGAQFAITRTGVLILGVVNPQFTFDSVTNYLIKVENLVPDDGRGRKFRLDSAITDSRYDRETKIVYMAYILMQNGRSDLHFYDTLTYIGPR